MKYSKDAQIDGWFIVNGDVTEFGYRSLSRDDKLNANACTHLQHQQE
jgi:hypothetical protein